MAARRNYGWMIYFVVLVVLSVGAIVGNILFNLGQQLTAAQLAEAKARWEESGAADYDLLAGVFHDRDKPPEQHIVLVRGGRVVFAWSDGEVIEASAGAGAALGLPLATQEAAWTVDRIFEHLQGLQREQEETKGKHFLVAAFDPQDGHPRRFVRRIARTRIREEWVLKLWPPGGLDPNLLRRR